MTFDPLKWISIGIIYSSRTIYLPSVKFLGQGVLELSVAQGMGDWHDLWPWPLTYWPEYQYLPTKIEVSWARRSWVISCIRCWRLTWPLTHRTEYQKGSSTRQGSSTYQVLSFWGKAFLSYQLHKVLETDMTFDLDLWPSELNINRDYLLIKDYLPTKFEASGAKRSGVISYTMLSDTDIQTDKCFFQWGINMES